jgi:hypothetical protein
MMAVRMVGSLIADRKLLIEFIEWLPPLRITEAYEVLLMVRSTGLRDKYGFKGSDHKLDSRVVHGYLSEIIPSNISVPFAGREYWRLRLYEDIVKLTVEATNAEWFYVHHKPGSRDIEYIYRIPWQLMGVMISINPANIMKASLSTVKDVIEAMWGIAGGAGLRDKYRRPDTRYHANCMKHTITRFHTVDIDNEYLSKRFLELVSSTFGYRPAIIKTRRGIHILINIEFLSERRLHRLYFGEMKREYKVLLGRYKELSKIKGKEEEVEKLRSELEKYVWDSNDPLFHRLNVASAIYTNERGGSLVEVKKKPIEPVPGTVYKEITVGFSPEEL